jgi:tryptophan-rich sensory protein
MLEGNYLFYYGIVLFVAVLSAIFVNIGLKTDKYKNAIKPDWYPEGYIFSIAWSIIYLLYGYSWTQASFYPYINGIFSINMILNFLWCFMFFYMGFWPIALGLLVALDGLLVLQITSLYKIDKLASIYLLPYLGWGLFATFLNYTIIHMNA